jgi:hypothetical protein
MAASKTNPQAGGRTPGHRSSIHKTRYVGDHAVKPTWYHGSREGHGNYMTGSIDGITVEDANGKPIPFKQIGELR